MFEARREYSDEGIEIESLHQDPLQQLQLWLKDAVTHQIPDASAMVIATVDATGFPDTRVVLLREIHSQGLIFYTNYESTKARQISSCQQVAVNFHWPQLERQIRIRGDISKVSQQQSQDYFASRPLESQAATIISPQSQIIETRQSLEDALAHCMSHSNHDMLKCPNNWGGYIIKPIEYEFYKGRKSRLNDRIQYCLTENKWVSHRLAP